MVVAGLVFVAGCTSPGSTESPSSGPLSGSLYGQSFTFASGVARSTAGTLYVTLSNQALSCTNQDPTGSSYGLVNLVIPSAAQSAGTYALGSDPAPHAVVSQYDTATPSQQSKMLTAGTLRVDSSDPTKLAGGLLVMDSDASLNGTFTATVCP